MEADFSIAYLILAHDDPLHLRRLIKRLHGERTAFHVHVDAKSDIEAFRSVTADIASVRLCETRAKVTWGAFSVVEATLLLLEAALAQPDKVFSRFVLLSGSDYPIASNTEIDSFFSRNPQKQFARGFNILEAQGKEIWRIRGRHLRELAPRYSWLRAPLFAVERGLRLFPRRLPTDLAFICGSQWWSITPDCARYCIDFTRTEPKTVGLFRLMFAPDEIFFHTLIHNSPYANTADPIEPFVDDVISSGSLRFYSNFHYVSPTTIRTYDEMRAAFDAHPRKLFARKFTSDASASVLDFIDRTLSCLPMPESEHQHSQF
jgi:hypothetical protein